MKFTLYLVILISLVSHKLDAQVSFVFGDDNSPFFSALDNQASAVLNIGSIEMTITAKTGSFNFTSTDFGINQPASGDDTDGFNFEESGGAGVAEGFTVSFNQDVVLKSIAVSSFGASDLIQLLDGESSLLTISSTGLTDLADYHLSSSSVLSVDTIGGAYSNGWTLESITVAPVPEPSSYSLFGAAGALGFSVFRRRKRY